MVQTFKKYSKLLRESFATEYSATRFNKKINLMGHKISSHCIIKFCYLQPDKQQVDNYVEGCSDFFTFK